MGRELDMGCELDIGRVWAASWTRIVFTRRFALIGRRVMIGQVLELFFLFDFLNRKMFQSKQNYIHQLLCRLKLTII